jgi:acyl-CoA thioesterase FadM
MPTAPADRVFRARYREAVRFVDLTERMALKLSAIPEYTARGHFVVWHKKIGRPDFENLRGVFTPLVHVDLEATDLRLEPRQPLHVAGETWLARTLDQAGDLRHLAREGQYVVRNAGGELVARARLVNVFTRYDPDPARRRVTSLPPELGLGSVPARTTEVPTVETMLPSARRPDITDGGTHAWHYEHTDANRHVNGMEYLRIMQAFVADALHARGHDVARLVFARARLVYRKPCFSGEGFRRVAWFVSEAPLVICGALLKADDPPDARPAAAVELTLHQHVAGR